jgi:hypothetical protein
MSEKTLIRHARVFDAFSGFLKDASAATLLYNVLGMIIYSERDGENQVVIRWTAYPFRHMARAFALARLFGRGTIGAGRDDERDTAGHELRFWRRKAAISPR